MNAHTKINQMIINAPVFLFPLVCASGIFTRCIALTEVAVFVFVNLIVCVIVQLLKVRHMRSGVLMVNYAPLWELFLCVLGISLIAETGLTKGDCLINLYTVLDH